jgi:hypothetical protein
LASGEVVLLAPETVDVLATTNLSGRVPLPLPTLFQNYRLEKTLPTLTADHAMLAQTCKFSRCYFERNLAVENAVPAYERIYEDVLGSRQEWRGLNSMRYLYLTRLAFKQHKTAGVQEHA